MRQRLRSHLTFANVASLIALFVALGGGTAFAAVIITSNSQVASGTISGHHPPSGKHPNIISNSVSNADVQNLQFQPLTLKNGWAGNCFGGGNPAIAKSVEGVVHLRGELCRTSGSSTNAFAVPPGLRPTRTEWIAVDEANSATGRIQINASGEAFVQDDRDHSGAAEVFTSLAGVGYTLPY
jgi:hypothetical protein